jgi:hypothetical protein
VYAARVAPDGRVLDANGVKLASAPRVDDGSTDSTPMSTSLSDGLTGLVAWNDNDVLRGVRLRLSPLESIDLTPFDLAPAANVLGIAALAPAPPGSALLFYGQLESNIGAQRVHGRIVRTGKLLGESCGAGGDCASAYCRDGVCCESACDGACLSCGGGGACKPVLGAPDPDTCAGPLSCSAQGECKRALGFVCTVGADCANGLCVDGFCCESACDGACGVCNDTPGRCTALPASSSGTPSCAPYLCNGQDTTCPTECASDAECATGYGCDRQSHQCVAYTVCTDAHTARAAGGTRLDCVPYLCRDNACLTKCSSIEDCAFPAMCDEAGRCVAPPAANVTGCSAAPARASRTAPWVVALALLTAIRRRRAR